MAAVSAGLSPRWRRANVSIGSSVSLCEGMRKKGSWGPCLRNRVLPGIQPLFDSCPDLEYDDCSMRPKAFATRESRAAYVDRTLAAMYSETPVPLAHRDAF